MATDKMREIYDLLVDEMKKVLVEGETQVTKDGEVVRVTPSASTMNVIRQFLKDNNIGGVDEPANKAKEVAQLLPFPKQAAKDNR